MEQVKEADKVVVAKPVASRPARSSFRSSSSADLRATAMNASAPNESSKTAPVPAIRPRTLRFKPSVVRAVPSAQAVCPPLDPVFKPDRITTVLYKPTPKLVSRTTLSVLKDMELAQSKAVQQTNVAEHQTDLQSELVQNFPSAADKEKQKLSSEIMMEEDHIHRSLSHTAGGDRPCYDGYNWRKYGQKQVKGSEYPRSYYKCTHPNCPVKKKIERSLNGQIAEIVYKGEHNHSKPRPQSLKRNSDEQWQGNMAMDSKQPLWSSTQQTENDRHKGTSGRTGHAFDLATAHSSYSGRVQPFYEEANSSCRSGEFEEGTKRLEAAESDEPIISKRRKYDEKSNEGSPSPVVVKNAMMDPAIMTDGFRWRKYGQKVVKGNPYPRSYYRCTDLKCNVRKYVERASDEPNAFITTYEGKHNHEMPAKNINSVTAKNQVTKAALGS